MKMPLDKVKIYLRTDGSEDDALLTSLILAAKQYLKNAGVSEPPVDDIGAIEQYHLATTLYVSMVYDGNSAIEPALIATILQIKKYSGGESA
jgi:uncharacterized phage protein (predicted DNA packaging)